MKALLLSCFLCVCLPISYVYADLRSYYIQAEKVWYDFAEDSEAGHYINNCTGKNYTDGAELYMQVGVGTRYLMARYIAYTDETFSIPYVIPKEELHLSVAGPMLRVVGGDTLRIYFKNSLEIDTTLTPSGVSLSKSDTEPVGTNETKIYEWNISSELAPNPPQASSKLYIYRSAVDEIIQQNMGLIGGMIVTNKNFANMTTGKPIDTDIEFLLMFHVFDMNQNLFLNETLDFYNMTDDYLAKSNQTDANWNEANLMHSINGKMFCWNKDFTIPENNRARWHAVVVGGEPDIHNFHWHGMVLNQSGSFVDQVSLFPGNVFSADMITDNPGTWLIHCHVNDHIHAGMVGLYTLEGNYLAKEDQGDIIEVFVAADEVEWDYAPYMTDMCGASPADLPDSAIELLTPDNFTLTIGNKQMKAIFNEYTDGTFSTVKAKDPTLGILGPTIYAKVGDTIKIHYKNNARFTTSMHPHGVLYDKRSEGAPYNDGTPDSWHLDDVVQNGDVYNYTWYVTERSGPAAMDGSSVMWMYHSHTHEIQDTYAGLMGAIIVTKRTMAKANNTPQDVDREYVIAYSIFNELSSFMLRVNLQKYFPDMPNLQYSNVAGNSAEFQDHENYHSINGFMFCNGPPFVANVFERVRIYIMSLGTEADLHTPSSSMQWMYQGHRSSSIIMIPGGMMTVDVVPTQSGLFHIQCRTAEHIEAGMIAKFLVEDIGDDDEAEASLELAPGARERKYYIAANLIEWDFAPNNVNECLNEVFDDDVSSQWGDNTMGKKFLKAIYQGYTDDSFTTLTEEEILSNDLAGPMIRAEVGDIITVVFKNNLNINVNIQLSGGFIPLRNNTDGEDGVEPGDTQTYSWVVNENNGPGVNDMSTIAFTYSSSVNPVADLSAGLYGLVVVARKGALNSLNLPEGINQEVALFFYTQDEQSSSLFEENLKYTNFVLPGEETANDDYTAWSSTTVFQTINGYIWCNGIPKELLVNSKVRWYLVGLGGETGLHTPIFENAVLLSQSNVAVTGNLAPTVSLVMDMIPTTTGIWKYQCDVQEHFEGGMQGFYRVVSSHSTSNNMSEAAFSPDSASI